MDLITITGKFLFLGSFFNEMLLDMRDYEGDKQNHIHTIPVVFGKKFTWYLASTILKINIFWNMFHLSILYNNYNVSVILFFILGPLLYDLREIKKSNYSKEMIAHSVNGTNKQLFMTLIYFCVISYYMK